MASGFRPTSERKVNGPARIFIHNAGLVDNDDEETRSVIKSIFKGKRTRIETYPSYSEVRHIWRLMTIGLI